MDISFESYGSIVNWTWDFGDGNISYWQNVTHSYAEKGTYTVTLTVTDDDGLNDSISKTIYIGFHIPLDYGWNLVTVPFENNWSAETLGQNITGCTVVIKFNASSQTFLSHVVGTPHDDFLIEDGVGYFVFCTQESMLSIRDLPISIVNVSVYEDWNMVGWYHNYSTTAESLGQVIYGCSVVTIFDAVNQIFFTHVVGIPHDDFIIKQGMGLFIYTTGASVWHGEG